MRRCSPKTPTEAPVGQLDQPLLGTGRGQPGRVAPSLDSSNPKGPQRPPGPDSSQLPALCPGREPLLSQPPRGPSPVTPHCPLCAPSVPACPLGQGIGFHRGERDIGFLLPVVACRTEGGDPQVPKPRKLSPQPPGPGSLSFHRGKLGPQSLGVLRNGKFVGKHCTVLRPVERGTGSQGVTSEQEGGALMRTAERTVAALPAWAPQRLLPMVPRLRGAKPLAGGGCHPDNDSLAIRGDGSFPFFLRVQRCGPWVAPGSRGADADVPPPPADRSLQGVPLHGLVLPCQLPWEES